MAGVVASIVEGLSLGGAYALISLGLVLAFRATKTFNFAHGELMLLPAFIVGYCQARHVSLGIALPLALAVGGIVGFLFYALVLRRTTGMELFMGIIATFGLAACLDGIMGIVFQAGQYQIVLPGVPTANFRIWGTGVSEGSLFIAGVTVALALVVVGVMRFTHLGLKILAAGQDPLLSSQSGLNVRRLHAGSWVVAAVLAAVAGIAYGSASTVDTSMINLGLAALPAIMLGGLDSIGGAVIGGIGVGLMQGFVQTYLGSTYLDLVTYGMLMLVLLLFPQGLFGSKSVVRA